MNDDNGVFLEEVEQLIEEGKIPDDVTPRLLWAALISRNKSGARMEKRVGRLETYQRVQTVLNGIIMGVGAYAMKLLIEQMQQIAVLLSK